MEISTDYLLKIIGVERTNRQLSDEENNNLRIQIKKLEEEKETIQKTLKEKIEGV